MNDRQEPPERMWMRYFFIAFTIFLNVGIVLNDIWWVCSAGVCLLMTVFLLLH